MELQVEEAKDNDDSASPEVAKFNEALLDVSDEAILFSLNLSRLSDEHERRPVDPLKISIPMPNRTRKQLPKVRCPEKIVFCLDICPDRKPFLSERGVRMPPLALMKETVEMFMMNKREISSQHEYALMSLYDGGTWAGEFTNDIDQLLESMESMTKVASQTRCNLSALFRSYTEKVVLPVTPRPGSDIPPYVLRLVLVYARSSVIPRFQDDSSSFNLLQTVPYFFLDVVYLHEPPSSVNLCQSILDALCELCDERSYVFEVVRDVHELKNAMAMLLSHPLQREKMDYSKPSKEKKFCDTEVVVRKDEDD